MGNLWKDWPDIFEECVIHLAALALLVLLFVAVGYFTGNIP
jgi:hypothetical protein